MFFVLEYFVLSLYPHHFKEMDYVVDTIGIIDKKSSNLTAVKHL